jgi:hypothetical protein
MLQVKTCAILRGDASGFREAAEITVHPWFYHALEVPDLNVGERFEQLSE